MEADSVLTKLINEFRVTAERMALNLPTNPFAEIVAGELRLKRDPALEEPPATPCYASYLHIACPRCGRRPTPSLSPLSPNRDNEGRWGTFSPHHLLLIKEIIGS